MNMDNFIKKITVLIKEQLGSNYDIRIETIRKNNDTELHGFVILRNDRQEKVTPTIYLEEFFQAYRDGIPLANIVQRIIDVYDTHHKELDFDVSTILNFNAIRNQISFHLINTERNTQLIQGIPHLQYLDFSIIFRINIESQAIGHGSITIKNDLLKSWGICVDELYQIALQNTPRLMPCSIKNISQVIDELHGGSGIDLIPMYVITNDRKERGCGCILYPDVIENFANVIRSDLYLLPSSIHEMIAIPVSYGNVYELKSIVHEVNCTQVSKEDFLSDNVYRYYRDTNRIEIITS